MNFRFFIAKRYLFAKKSHNVINIISLISAVGIAIGTMALIVVLSVSNGFNKLIEELYGSHDADLLIVPVKGKVFEPDPELYNSIKADERVATYSEIIEDNAFLLYEGKESTATVKGVDSVYEHNTQLFHFLVEGEFELYKGDVAQAVLGYGLAKELGVRTRFVSPIHIYYIERDREISLLDPTSSMREEKLFPSGIIAVEQEFDKKYIFVPIATARSLFGYETELSSIEINVSEGVNKKSFKKELQAKVGQEMIIKDRFQQNETVYKMMVTEKTVIFIILLFIILIISFNVFGSLSMLVMEKKEDIQTLKSLGADRRSIRRIFEIEGMMIVGLGAVTGLILGVGITLIQQKFKLIKMSGNFIVDSYPVILNPVDILITLVSIGIIGILITRLPKKHNKYFI